MAVFFLGKSMYGMVDQIPGIAFVATEFFHFQGYPVYPSNSYLVVEETESAIKWRSSGVPLSRSLWAVEDREKLPVGLPLPFQRRSMWFGYVRAILWLLLGISIIPAVLVFVVIMPPERRLVTIAVLDLIPVTAGLALWTSYRITHATAERKSSLLTFLGSSPTVQTPSQIPSFLPSLLREVAKVVFGLSILAFICFVIATLCLILAPHN